jgi:hypothetical protein
MMMEQNTARDVDVTCKFCGKSRHDVRVILTSAESAICDECVEHAMDIIASQPGNPIHRFAYFVFKCIASQAVWFRVRRRPRGASP